MIKLKLLLFLFFVSTVTPLALFGQCTLTIQITGLNNSTGQVLLELRDEKNERIAGISRNIADNSCIFVIKNLKPGKFAFKYFHDQNNNEELDTNWIGIPTEGYGFSNNAEGTFGPPSFKEMIFSLLKDTTLTCVPKYINF